MQDMVDLQEVMVTVAMSLNTNVSDLMKRNAIPLLVLYRLIIAKIERRKFA